MRNSTTTRFVWFWFSLIFLMLLFQENARFVTRSNSLFKKTRDLSVSFLKKTKHFLCSFPPLSPLSTSPPHFYSLSSQSPLSPLPLCLPFILSFPPSFSARIAKSSSSTISLTSGSSTETLFMSAMTSRASCARFVPSKWRLLRRLAPHLAIWKEKGNLRGFREEKYAWE